jgi:hypothetical protein
MVAGQAKKLWKTPVAEFDWPIIYPEVSEARETTRFAFWERGETQ